MKTIEQFGDRYVVMEDEAIVSIHYTYKQASDSLHNWDRRLWSWPSLYDAEHEIQAKQTDTWYRRDLEW